MRNASRIVGRETPNCSISRVSGGSFSPGFTAPRTIRRRNWAAIRSRTAPPVQ